MESGNLAVNIKEFQEDVKNMSIEECCKKHQISFSKITQILIANKKGRIATENLNHNKENPNKYITSRGNRYFIQKQIDKERLYFGMFRTIEDARLVRDGLVECDWDSTQFENILKQKKVKKLPSGTCLNKNSYIFKTKWGTFCVKKSHKLDNGKFRVKYYGTYATIEEARLIRDGLIRYGWNKQQLFRVKRKYGITDTLGR